MMSIIRWHGTLAGLNKYQPEAIPIRIIITWEYYPVCMFQALSAEKYFFMNSSREKVISLILLPEEMT